MLIVGEKKREKTMLSLAQTFEAIKYLEKDFSINKCF